jgi:hypothetical protein
MKKKSVRASGKTHTRTAKRIQTGGKQKNFLFVLKSWMFVVMFALMLGVGAIVGTYLSEQMSAATPQVAGASIEQPVNP